MKRYRWSIPDADEAAVEALSAAINVSTPIARALCNRGVSTYDEAKAFFRSSLESLSSPFLLGDMQKAADRVALALQRGERIMIYGDYDVDGTTGTAMLHLFLQERGAEVSWYINDRFSEGYGLSDEGIAAAIERGVGLLVTVDCGIRAEEAIGKAVAAGIDVIVCDHHEPEALPPAFAILNPKVEGCGYPFRELCGCGVAFRFIQAIAEVTGAGESAWMPFLDYVAIATAADMVSLEEENRVLVREGLALMRRSPRPNLREMFSLMKVQPGELGMFNIAFGIAPRINAAGRMESASMAIDWLLAGGGEEGRRLAGELDRVNALRRQMDGEILARAEAMLEGHFASYCSSIVLYDESWHLGVLGIVASKLLERHYLPTVVLGGLNGMVKGSVRSVGSVNVFEVLQECSEHLVQFGGHSQAAGVTLRPENLAPFRKAFDEACAARLQLEERQKELVVDSRLALDEVSAKFIGVLEQFAPHGFGNREPLFLSEEVDLCGRPRLLRERHVKFNVSDLRGRTFEVIGFDRPDIFEELSAASNQAAVSMVYAIEKRFWQGREQWQLKLKDLELLRR